MQEKTTSAVIKNSILFNNNKTTNKLNCLILSRAGVTVHGDWIGELSYWPPTGRNYK
jgi:hypothetical protein